MAARLLPSAAALDELDRWMAAPRQAFCDAQHFASFACEVGAEAAYPEFELWRAQFAVLLAEVEIQRLAIVRGHSDRWSLPYLAEGTEGRLPKLIEAAECLELRHLCRILRNAGEPRYSPLMERLQYLRDLRNALSHLEPASPADLSILGSPIGA